MSAYKYKMSEQMLQTPLAFCFTNDCECHPYDNAYKGTSMEMHSLGKIQPVNQHFLQIYVRVFDKDHDGYCSDYDNVIVLPPKMLTLYASIPDFLSNRSDLFEQEKLLNTSETSPFFEDFSIYRCCKSYVEHGGSGVCELSSEVNVIEITRAVALNPPQPAP